MARSSARMRSTASSGGLVTPSAAQSTLQSTKTTSWSCYSSSTYQMCGATTMRSIVGSSATMRSASGGAWLASALYCLKDATLRACTGNDEPTTSVNWSTSHST